MSCKPLGTPLILQGDLLSVRSVYGNLVTESPPEMEGELIAHHLGELRRALGVDQIELAERLGMTQGGLSRLERSADPKLSTLRKLTAALGGTLRIEVAVGDRVFQLAPG